MSGVRQAEDDARAQWCRKHLSGAWWRHVDFNDVTSIPCADVASVMWRHGKAKQHASSQWRTKVEFQGDFKVIDNDWTQSLIPAVHPEQFTTAQLQQQNYCNELVDSTSD